MNINLKIIRFQVLICLFCFCRVIAQDLRPVAQLVQDMHRMRITPYKCSLFREDRQKTKSQVYRKAAANVTVMDIVPGKLLRFLKDKPELVVLSFPYSGDTLTVELCRYQMTTADFVLSTSGGENISYEPGIYYRGIIKDDPGSVAAFSFFAGRVMGVASPSSGGSIVLGQTKETSQTVVYDDRLLTSINPFVCRSDELPQMNGTAAAYDPRTMGDSSGKMATKCVRMYYELGYNTYLNNGSDIYATADWLTGIHNNIATLFYNDGISISLNEIKVWNSPDPYTGDYGKNLSDFSVNRQVFNGDLAHFVNFPATTSVAYVNSLCTTYRHAYSGVDQIYADVPAYSWTIGAMTHEMGHSFGSPHTHACAWNGTNTAIDGCGPAVGYNEGCNGPIPTSGTIMSYCHLLPIGVNLANGFGPQPAALMRNTINSKGCITTNCISGCATPGNIIINTAVVSGDINSCVTWGNPAAIVRNTLDTKTVNNGVTVNTNENWSTKAVSLKGSGAIQLPAGRSLDFTVDQGADKGCGCP